LLLGGCVIFSQIIKVERFVESNEYGFEQHEMEERASANMRVTVRMQNGPKFVVACNL
jgi:hypothetical protein